MGRESNGGSSKYVSLETLITDVQGIRDVSDKTHSSVTELTLAITNLCASLDKLEVVIEQSIKTQQSAVPIKLVLYMFLILSAVVSGEQLLKHLIEVR